MAMQSSSLPQISCQVPCAAAGHRGLNRNAVNRLPHCSRATRQANNGGHAVQPLLLVDGMPCDRAAKAIESLSQASEQMPGPRRDMSDSTIEQADSVI
jgi:hypothetical protein